MVAGVSSAGLEIKTVQQILAEIGNAQLSILGAGLDLSPDQPIGQLNGVMATKLAEAWEVAQTSYNAFNPNAAEGFLLDVIGLLRGVPRLDSTYGTVNLTVNLDVGTTLTSGVATANVVGQPANRWVIVDTFTAPSSGNFTRTFRSSVKGIQNANSGAITEITTAVAGWNSVTNTLSAVSGRPIESDTDYRLRQATQLSASGSTTVDSILADLLALAGMLQVVVFENTGDVVNTLGLPPHSFEAVIRDGGIIANTTIAQTIWDNKPAGIATYGSTLGTAVDKLGQNRGVNFSRAAAVNVMVDVGTLTVLPGWNAGQIANIQARITTYFQSLKVGEDVVVNKILALVMAEPFVWNCSGVTLNGSITSGALVVDPRSYAVLNPFVTPFVNQLTGTP